ncbi:alcohol dehydrogenase catalytic domain-containing protein [Microbacter sp. GSS18]|nr:alcohol dehydrogenase catalytic domain-containing protein [Microbacter sp. GSS18]
MSTHLQLRLTGHRQVEAVEVPDREPGPGQVRVRVAAASLCPTDVKKWNDAALAERLDGAPLVLGHEFAGVVDAIGDDVESVSLGDRVAVDPVLRCGACRWCLGGKPGHCTALLGIGAAAGDAAECAGLARTIGITGGFEESTIVPAGQLIPLADGVSMAAGALVEPLADVVHAVRAARVRPGERAAVIGLGPMGLLHVEVLAAAGAEVTGVDLREDRNDVCRDLGSPAVTPDGLEETDVAFVVAGGGGYAPALELALDRLAPGGRVVLFSSAPRGVVVPIDTNRIHYRRQQMIGVVGFDPEDAERAVELLARGAVSVDRIRTPRVSLADAQAAFENVTGPGVLKAAIDFGGGA